MTASPAVPDLSRALPDRPIGVRPPQTVQPTSAAGLFLLLFGLLAGLLTWLGPDLARDWRIGGETVRAEGVRIEQARCRSRLAAIILCDVAFIDERAEEARRRTLWYFFIGTAAREPIVLVAPISDPAAIATNLGLDKFYHRLLALTLLAGLLVTCIVFCYQVVRQGMATRAALSALDGQRLVPVVVALEGRLTVGRKRRRWTYLYDAGDRMEQAFVELASKDEPLYVTLDGKRALAVSGARGGVPLLLDRHLSALDLTEAEKAAFLETCRAALGETGAA
jgi:hypothetical protein